MKGAAPSFETTEFRHEFEAETNRMLRRRLIWFACVWMGVTLALMLIALVGLAVITVQFNSAADEPLPPAQAVFDRLFEQFGSPFNLVLVVVLNVFWFAGYVSAIWLAATKRVAERGVLRLTMGLILLEAVTQVIARSVGIPMSGLGAVVLVHFIACCVFPWTIRQAVLPMAAAIAISSISHIAFEGSSFFDTLVLGLLVAMAATPGVLVVWWRLHQRMVRSSNKFLQRRYGMLRQELAYARQLHESLFPTPRLEGEVRLAYTYEPMRQIGGDYLHANLSKTDGRERVSLVLLDVTGHGIPAALTVNRLHGEIDLRFADEPDIAPGELLARLNRYVRLTLARHSIYATAICLRADPARGVLEYASGGHPPAFVRGADGSVTELESTTFVLGATDDELFGNATREVRFTPGDTLIAYTDGATEARGPTGGMLRIDGLRGAVATANGVPRVGEWADHLLDLVAKHRGGLPPEDDTLVVELYRPLRAH